MLASGRPCLGTAPDVRAFVLGGRYHERLVV